MYTSEVNQNLWTVGFYAPSGNWISESDHFTSEEAAKRVSFLNGGSMVNNVAYVQNKTEYNNNDYGSIISGRYDNGGW